MQGKEIQNWIEVFTVAKRRVSFHPPVKSLVKKNMIEQSNCVRHVVFTQAVSTAFVLVLNLFS